MDKNINDKMRDNILKVKDTNQLIKFLNGLGKDQKEYVIRLMFSDYYKINYCNYLATGDSNWIAKFAKLNKTILNSENYNTDDLNLLMENCKNFAKLDFFSKSIIIETITSNGQDEMLEQINKLHVLDKFIYKIDYSLDSFKEYYLDYMEHNGNTKEAKQKIDFLISTKIAKLKSENYLYYKKCILEIISKYYRWNIFIKEKGGADLLFQNDIKYLNIIKKMSIDEICEIADKDFKFLEDIVSEYLSFSTNENLDDRIAIDYMDNIIRNGSNKKSNSK